MKFQSFKFRSQVTRILLNKNKLGKIKEFIQTWFFKNIHSLHSLHRLQSFYSKSATKEPFHDFWEAMKASWFCPPSCAISSKFFLVFHDRPCRRSCRKIVAHFPQNCWDLCTLKRLNRRSWNRKFRTLEHFQSKRLQFGRIPRRFARYSRIAPKPQVC